MILFEVLFVAVLVLIPLFVAAGVYVRFFKYRDFNKTRSKEYKPCSDCAHYRPATFYRLLGPGAALDNARCGESKLGRYKTRSSRAHLGLKRQVKSKDFRYCATMRESSFLCGPQAKFFKERGLDDQTA